MMRRNLRKAMSAVLVAAMTFGTPIAVNQNVTVAEAAESNIISENKDFGATGETVEIGNYLSAYSVPFAIKKHAITTVVFDNTHTTEANYQNIVVEGDSASKSDDMYKLRADNWANECQDGVTITKDMLSVTGSDDAWNWDDFRVNTQGKTTISAWTEGTDTVWYQLTFPDNKKDGKNYVVKYKAVYKDGIPDDLTFRITGEKTTVVLNKVTFEDNTATKHSVTKPFDADKTLDGGTIYYSKLNANAYYGDTVSIETKVNDGYGPTASIETAKGEEIKSTIQIDDEDTSKKYITFTMPNENVVIKDISFVGVRDMLKTLIAEAKKYNNDSETVSSKYTKESFEALTTALNNAENAMNKQDVKEIELENVKSALQDAINSLVLKHDVTLNKQSANLLIGDELSVEREDVSEDGTTDGTWSTSNDSVATVSADGKITAVSDGIAVISYTAADGTKADCKIKVLATKLTPGASVNYSTIINKKNVTWTSSDAKVASVNSDGVVTASSAGIAVITAAYEDTTREINVTVEDNFTSDGFNATRTQKFDVTENGTYASFHAKSLSDEQNYFCPVIFVVSEDKTEEWFVRSDLYAGDVAIEAIGATPSWEDYKKELSNGTDCYLSATESSEGTVITLSTGSLSERAVIPTTAGKKYQVYITAEKCTLSSIKSLSRDDFNKNDTVPIIPANPAAPAKPAVTPAPEVDVPLNPANVIAEETLTGTAWWTGNVYGQAYALNSGDSKTELFVSADKSINGYCAFNVEIFGGDQYLTTGSDVNAWFNGATGELPTFSDLNSKIQEGHVYRITITRKGADITVKYYDATAQEDYCEITAKNTTLAADMSVRIIAQVGTYSIGQSLDLTATPAPTASAPAETTAPDNTAAPTTEPSAEPSADVTEAPTTAPSTEPSKTPAANTVSKGDKATVSGAKYVATSSKEVSYTAAKKATASVVIPATVKVNGKTLKVTSIAAKAFKGNKTVKSLTVGKNVTTIGANAFNGCKKLKTLTIKSTKLSASKIAKNAFKGISKKTTVKVPKNKLKAYKKLLRKKGLAKSVGVKAL